MLQSSPEAIQDRLEGGGELSEVEEYLKGRADQRWILKWSIVPGGMKRGGGGGGIEGLLQEN